MMFEGVLCLTVRTSQDICADVMLFPFSGEQRLGTLADHGNGYCLLRFEMNSDKTAGDWINLGWIYDEYGEWEYLKSPRHGMYDKRETTVE
jgi:hypothetical protein